MTPDGTTSREAPEGWESGGRNFSYEQYVRGLLYELSSATTIDGINLIPPYDWLWPLTLSQRVAQLHTKYWRINADCVHKGQLKVVRRVTFVYSIQQLINPLYDGIWKSTKMHLRDRIHPDAWLRKVVSDVENKTYTERQSRMLIQRVLKGYSSKRRPASTLNHRIAEHVLKKFEKLHTSSQRGGAYYVVVGSNKGREIWEWYNKGEGYVESVLYNNDHLRGIKEMPYAWDDKVRVYTYKWSNPEHRHILEAQRDLRNQLVDYISECKCKDWMAAGSIRNLIMQKKEWP